MAGVRHLYVHLPFCASRCGYCDFVTVVGQGGRHAEYVDAVLAELELERCVLAAEPETVFLGGGTPTFTAAGELARLLAALPPAGEVTVEANPETVTPGLARLLSRERVTRVSIGAQSFNTSLLDVLERRARPDDVRRAVYVLRDASFDNISLDLVYGIPGQTPADLEGDLEEALALEPEHLSCYELEAKPGTRFAHTYGDELVRQSEAMEDYFERVVRTLTSAGYRWYETANFCRTPERAGGRDLRARHNLAYWLGRDYLGLGIGAVSTVDARRLPRRACPRRAAGTRDRADRAAGSPARARDARASARRAVAARRARGRRRPGGASADGAARARDPPRRERGRRPGADHPWARPRRRGDGGAARVAGPRPSVKCLQRGRSRAENDDRAHRAAA
jgi:putative oxygen-independent coproporphyrinogen III oxidase